MREASLTLRPPTWARLEQTALALGLDPDDVIESGAYAEAKLTDEADADDVLALLVEGDAGTRTPEEAVALAAWCAMEYITACRREAARAHAQAQRYAVERLGVFTSDEGETVGLTRALAGYSPAEASHLRALPLGEMLYRLFVRGAIARHNARKR